MEGMNLFFCNSDEIGSFSKSIQNPKVGCTFAGGIENGLTDRNVRALLDSRDFATRVIKIEDTTLPILKVKELKSSLNDLKKEGYKSIVALVLNDGLSGSEEMLQSLLARVLNDVTIIGGSSGDNLRFENTYCCIDDEVFKGALVMLIGTNLEVYVTKENIYEPTDKYAIVTKSNGRDILELDNKPTTKRYAEMLGVQESKVDAMFFESPLGRHSEQGIIISSPKEVGVGGRVSFYSETLPSTVLHLLKPIDYRSKIKETVDDILSRGNPVVTLTINCILRKLLFERDNSVDFISEQLKRVNAFGFTSYGEQLNDMHINQTMIMLAFYRR